MKVGRVKFAVKEIRYKSKEEAMTDIEPPKKSVIDDDFEEYEEVESIMKVVEEGVPEEELKRCRFCW